jgi:hypothetical protein
MKRQVIVALTALLVSGIASAQVCKEGVIKPTAQADRFIDHKDGTVTDSKTGLMWSVCSVGQSYDEGKCSGLSESKDWAQSLQDIQALNNAGGQAGYADWRMPNIDELATIVEFQCFDPAIQLSVFPATPSETYWSSTPDPSKSGKGRSIYFKYGTDITPEVATDRFTRLVRDPK